jgi:hypothetical protein
MSHLTSETLEKIAELVATAASWRQICVAVGIRSESTLWNWRARCLADQKKEDFSSPFFISFRGERTWWTDACARSRRESLILGESIIKQQAISGIEEIVRDGNQQIVYQKNPLYISRPDSYVMFSEGCDESEVAWHRLLHDENGLPIPETVTRQAPAQLRLRVLEASNSEYRPSSHQTIDVQGGLKIVHEAKPIARKPDEPSVSISELRALAALSPEARRDKLGASKFPIDPATGMRTIPRIAAPSYADAPDDQHRGLRPPPPPYVPPQQPAPQPQAQPRPSYAKPSRSEDHIGEGNMDRERGGPADGPGCIR